MAARRSTMARSTPNSTERVRLLLGSLLVQSNLFRGICFQSTVCHFPAPRHPITPPCRRRSTVVLCCGPLPLDSCRYPNAIGACNRCILCDGTVTWSGARAQVHSDPLSQRLSQDRRCSGFHTINITHSDTLTSIKLPSIQPSLSHACSL